MSNSIKTFQHINKYARWIEEKGRRETWRETVEDRVIPFFQKRYGARINNKTWAWLSDMLLEENASFAMRVIQMAGPAMERCNVAGYNCAYCPVETVSDFSDILYILMQGTGCAFSVEDKYVSQLPVVQAQIDRPAFKYIVPDTTEGWCDALDYGLHAWYIGRDVIFDFSEIRPAGSRLATKGGYASGPGPLKELLDFTRSTLLEAVGRRLTSFEVHRICCKIGRIVEVGGVRRAAMLSLSDLDDSAMRTCKKDYFWETMPELSMANNSAVYQGPFDEAAFEREWENLRSSGTGERGIFNRDCNIPSRREHREFGTNPCGEILLRPRQFCNLTMAIVRPADTLDDIIHKVRAAAVMGTLQAGLTKFQYISPKWQENCREEALLGVDIMGALDNPVLQQPGVLNCLKEIVIATNREWAERLGIRPSAATTCIKPGGNSSERYGTGNSVTGWYARYIHRRVRVNNIDPMCQFLKDQGVLWEASVYNEPVTVFSFYKEAPPTAVLRQDRSILDQLNWWLRLKKEWTEHNPSVTIYVKPDEWDLVKDWVKANWEHVGGLAFLPFSDAVYPQQPLSEMTEEDYKAAVAKFPHIEWEHFGDYERLLGDTTVVGQEMACLGGACEL